MTIKYPINDCYTCIQGEGVQSGTAMVLLRLHGCAVGCPWCDTKETWEMNTQFEAPTLSQALGATPNYSWLTPTAIVEHIQAHHQGPQWILITGGEPAQYDLRPLTATLQQHGYRVAIETSGTEHGHLNAGIDWICVSPKLNMPGGKVVHTDALTVADEIKHVVGKQSDIDELDTLLQATPLKTGVQICLQPVSQSRKATKLCIDTVQKRGWRLSVQMHKYLDVR